jgi:hypothetical protein
VLPELDAVTFRIAKSGELALALGISSDGQRRRLDPRALQAKEAANE